jgi:hypothetical protein
MKKLLIIPILLAAAFTGFSQQITGVGEPNPETLGTDTAQQKLQELSVSKFEDQGFWRVHISQDDGLITMRRFEGAPAAKEPIPEEQSLGIAERDIYVLGAKTNFYRRSSSSFSIEPVKPLAVPGIVKTISVWVVGRNTPHNLVLLLKDHFGHYIELNMGKLNFTGWKKMTVAIPPSIVQQDYHYQHKMGLQIIGFRVDCDLLETYGTYYIYFDDLRATTDLFAEEARDPDDMVDGW